MKYELIDLVKAWDKTVKGHKSYRQISCAVNSKLFFNFTNELMKIRTRRDKKKWARNED